MQGVMVRDGMSAAEPCHEFETNLRALEPAEARARQRRLLARVLCYGVLGATIAIASLAALAVADAQIHSEAVIRLISWY